MDFECQSKALRDLSILASHNTHGIVLSGMEGSGRKYLAMQYAKFLNANDFHIIGSTMSEIKAMVDMALTSDHLVVFCIQDMDDGVISVAYPLLKLIEDSPSNVYVIITCHNINQVPDTIISRCSVINIPTPSKSDLYLYGITKNPDKGEELSKKLIWKCVKTFSDIDAVFDLNPEQFAYLDNLANELVKPKLNVSSFAWRLQHFEDKTPTPLVIVIRYLMIIDKTQIGNAVYLRCLNELQHNRMSVNAILTKLVFDLKYLE